MAEVRPHFDLVRVLPSFVQGRNELVTRVSDVHHRRNNVMVHLVLGRKATAPQFANTVLVDDVARTMIAALTKGKAGACYIAAGSPSGKSIRWDDVTGIAERLFPEAVEKGVLPLGGSQESMELNFDVKNTEEELGVQFAGLEEQVKSLIGQYVELAEKE